MTKKILLCVLSAVLLAFSFPKANLSFVAFVALVPLMAVLDGEKAKRSFALAYLCGFVFFFMTFSWLLFVTKLGTFFLLVFLALYLGLFGIGYNWLSKKRLLVKIFLIPALWVTIEYIRAHFLTGFGWALLGHSQYKNLWLIQIADVTGVYGVSFLVVMVNVVVYEALLAKPKALPKEFFGALSIVTILVGASIIYSLNVLKNNFDGPRIRVGVAQGNVALARHWSPRERPLILRDYFALSKKLAEKNVDLIVWPESSYPGNTAEQLPSFELLKSFIAQTKIPHLVGIIVKEGENYFNSALLFSSEGDIVERYDKLHLVPFGEYIPWRNRLPFLAAIVPIDDFRFGQNYTLFKTSQGRYSVLICFEDTLPELTSAFVKKGAGFLVNISNDAWFGDTKEPFLHLASAVFRSVENRRSLVRCGNVGLSCFIDSAGRLINSVEVQGKKTYISGAAAENIFLSDRKTLYTKFGEIFAYFCISGILGKAAWDIAARRKSRLKSRRPHA